MIIWWKNRTHDGLWNAAFAISANTFIAAILPVAVIGGKAEALGFYAGGPVAGDYNSGGAARAGYSTGGAVAGQMAPLGGS